MIESNSVRKFSKTMIKEANELSSFDAQIGHTCVNNGIMCTYNRGGSLTKEGEREGKERKGKLKECVLYNFLPILYSRRDKVASNLIP